MSDTEEMLLQGCLKSDAELEKVSWNINRYLTLYKRNLASYQEDLEKVLQAYKIIQQI